MHTRKLAPLCSAVILILITLLLANLLTALTDPYDRRILNGTHVAGIDVGRMTKREARTALKQAAAALQEQDMVVQLPEETLTFPAEITQIQLDIPRAVSAAYAYGRDGSNEENQTAAKAAGTQIHHTEILSCLRWNEDAILSQLNAYAGQYDTTFAETVIHLEGTTPELEETKFQPDSKGQTLMITLGIPGFALEVEKLYADILEAYSQGVFLVDWSGVLPQSVPIMPDVNALYTQYCTEPVDAMLDFENKTAIPAIYGHCFDAKKAQTLLQKAAYGETVALPMEIIEPKIKTEDLYFQDILGTYTSGHPQLLNYHTNLELVCQFINGTVLQPGEVFSFNDTVGERTVERGFMYGDSFSGITRSKSAGGGICQGSSILHVCVLEAELEVVERAPHGLPVGYAPLGQDAAVSWGGPDFRFRNTSNFPIKIVAENEKLLTRMYILGTDERDYYVRLESTRGSTDTQIHANCYKRKYDKETNELLSREVILRTSYLKLSDE